jgi:hypothetical protein
MSSRDDRPRNVIQTTSVVVDEVADPQSPTDGKATDLLNSCDDAVTLSVVLRPRNKGNPIGLAVNAKGFDLRLERFGFGYRPSPFEPSAIEQSIHAGTLP